MGLGKGERLGAFEIIGVLGTGGMGEVYRARDTELGRDVAIKVLPPAFAADVERLARFQREAQVLASLNHPRIAAIYSLQRTANAQALVLELVEGETLAERIGRGPIALGEALEIARQMAEALEVAHERGIVHRDLKPSNIKLDRSGAVKVLDFGLAKAVEGPRGVRPQQPDLSASPTNASPAVTHAGLILGTAAYMAPEQARGLEVDSRADVWAFACVLYEMLTGRRAFPGDDVTETLAGVVLRDPDWNALPAGTPDAVRRVLNRCLRKDPAQRLHHIADARLELEGPQEPGVNGQSPSRRLPWQLTLAATVALTLAGIAGARTLWLSQSGIEPRGLVRFVVMPPDNVAFVGGGVSTAVMSPDGSRIVLAYSRPTPQLFVRRLDESEAQPLPGTEGGFRPFFSPDGKWLAFSTGDAIKRISVEGGPPVSVVASTFGGGAWASDDTIVFTPNYSAGLWRVSASGGTPEKLTEPNAADGELGHFWPELLPDEKSVLFTSIRSPLDRSRIEVYSFDSRTRKVVVDGGFCGRYLSTGHLLFARSTAVMGTAFDVRKWETVGQPVPVLSDVAINATVGLALLSVAPSGTLVYVPQTSSNRQGQLAWIDRKGDANPLSDERRQFGEPRVSPDGRRIALTILDENQTDIWQYDVTRGTFGRVTSSPQSEAGPTWSPDGRRLFFAVEEPVRHIYSVAANGTEKQQLVAGGPFDLFPRSVSSDGRFLIYQRNDPSTRSGIWLMPLAGDPTPRAFVDTRSSETFGAVSPGGTWLTYTSDETGRNEVYVQAFPNGGERVQVSTDGGQNPRWSPDGRELFYRDGNRMMAVPVQGRSMGRPSMLFEKRWFGWDMAPDGRFVALLPDTAELSTQVNVVLNWFDELKRLVPVP